MGRSRGQKSRGRNKATLPQVPKDMKSEKNDVEFTREFPDGEELEAIARAAAAGIRQGEERKKG